jgi:DNA-binding Lrp family transcriptional regulator
MTIKQKILNLLNDDGKSKHYLVIAKKINKNPNSVIVILNKLKEEGLVEVPTVVVVTMKTNRGFYRASGSLERRLEAIKEETIQNIKNIKPKTS